MADLRLFVTCVLEAMASRGLRYHMDSMDLGGSNWNFRSHEIFDSTVLLTAIGLIYLSAIQGTCYHVSAMLCACGVLKGISPSEPLRAVDRESRLQIAMNTLS